MQLVCPECDKVGLLQKITPRYYRIRHSIITSHIATWTGREFNERTFSYCRISTEWAEQKIMEKQLKEEAEMKAFWAEH